MTHFPAGIRWRWIALLAVLLAAGVLAGCDRGPRLEPLAPGGRILAFGDSLTRGVGAAPEQSYPAALARRVGRPVINAGLPGELSREGLRRLPAVLEEVRPALVLLCHGGNDILRGFNPDATRRNLEAMVQLSRDHGAQVALIGVPDRSLLFLETADIYRDVAQATGVPLEDEALADIIGDAALRSDRVHPNAEGYRRLAAAVADLLEQAGALPP